MQMQESQSSLPGIARRKTRVNALMTRQSILFARSSCEERWTRGSGPRVTEGLRGPSRVRGRREQQSQSSLPGLTRQSIQFAKMFLRRTMDPRVKPAGDL